MNATCPTVPAFTLQPGDCVVERDGAVLTLASVSRLPRNRLILRFAPYGSTAGISATVRAAALVRVPLVAP